MGQIFGVWTILRVLKEGENSFMRSVLMLTWNAPLTPLWLDLCLKNMVHVAAFKPLACRFRVWTSNSPVPLRQSFTEVRMQDKMGRIPWFKYIKTWMNRLRVSEFWDNPEWVKKDTLAYLKIRYWNYIYENWFCKNDAGILKERFLDFKNNRVFEPFLDRIEPP